jgi:tetratricopeptide (TPR) repeat protein/O-antigen ligase
MVEEILLEETIVEESLVEEPLVEEPLVEEKLVEATLARKLSAKKPVAKDQSIKKSSLMHVICDKISKLSIYLLIFLMPIFFLPWTSDILDFNKQILLIVLSFVALFAWMLKALISGKFEINTSKMHIIVGSLFVVYLLATIFSVNRYGSFWGWPQSSADSFITLIALAISYFLISSTFSRKNILSGIVVLSVSALITEIVGVLQLLGLFVIPFAFAKSTSFNTLGSVGSLGFFAAILLPLTIVMLIGYKKWWRVLFFAELILSILILFLVNYPIIWWVVFVGCAVLMIFGAVKRNFFDGRWMSLPVFFLAISLFFILLNPQIPWVSQRSNEIFLSQKTSIDISWQAIKERPIFGSGPGTFAYDFLKFKDQNFSQSSLWNVTFNQGGSKALNDLASTGVLGLLAILALISFPLYYGVKFLAKEKSSVSDLEQKKAVKIYWLLIMGILTVICAQVAMFFLYSLNITLVFLTFLMIASLMGLITSNKKEYELKPSSLMTIISTFVFTIVFIFGLGLLILVGQRYVAEVNYYQALLSFQDGKLEAGTKSLESAINLNSSSDLYFAQLSQAYLLSLQAELKGLTAAPTDAEKTKIQALAVNSINAAKIATDLNPNSSADWANRGYVYQNLNGLVEYALDWSLGSYESALKLEPNSPYILFQQGSVNFISASALGADMADKKSKLLNTAKDKLERATTLNPTYSDALYFLGLVYDALGQKDKAVEKFTTVLQLNPKDTVIPKILSNLKAGLPALQSIATEDATPTSTTKEPIKNTNPK